MHSHTDMSEDIVALNIVWLTQLRANPAAMEKTVSHDIVSRLCAFSDDDITRMANSITVLLFRSQPGAKHKEASKGAIQLNTLDTLTYLSTIREYSHRPEGPLVTGWSLDDLSESRDWSVTDLRQMSHEGQQFELLFDPMFWKTAIQNLDACGVETASAITPWVITHACRQAQRVGVMS